MVVGVGQRAAAIAMRLVVLFLVALVVGGCGVSDNGGPGAKTRVGAFALAGPPGTGAGLAQSPCTHRGSEPARSEIALRFCVAAEGAGRLTYLYQKVGAEGEHLKFGISNNPAGRYTAGELNGGRLRILTSGSRSDMLALERKLHETLPIGPEERQAFYIQKQMAKGLKPPPY